MQACVFAHICDEYVICLTPASQKGRDTLTLPPQDRENKPERRVGILPN